MSYDENALPRRELDPDERKRLESMKPQVQQIKTNIRIGVGLNKATGKVGLQFSHPINVIELEPDVALEIARNLKKQAKKSRKLIEEMIKEGRTPPTAMPEATRIVMPSRVPAMRPPFGR